MPKQQKTIPASGWSLDQQPFGIESTFNHRNAIEEGAEHFVLHLKPTVRLGEFVSPIVATLKPPIALLKRLHELATVNEQWLCVEDVL